MTEMKHRLFLNVGTKQPNIRDKIIRKKLDELLKNVSQSLLSGSKHPYGVDD